MHLHATAVCLLAEGLCALASYPKAGDVNGHLQEFLSRFSARHAAVVVKENGACTERADFDVVVARPEGH